MTPAEIEHWILSMIAEITGAEAGPYAPGTTFDDIGLSSRDAVVLMGELQRYLDRPLPPTLAWDYPNARALARHLAGSSCEAAAAGPRPVVASPPAAAESQGEYPLSRAQQEMWLLHKLGPDHSRAYTEGVLLELRGELDTGALRWTLAQVLARHDSLHAVITPDGLRQRVLSPPPEPELPLVDFTGLASAERARRLTAWLEARTREVLDLTARPPVRTALLRLGADDHWLYMAVHHILIDGWSFDVIAAELAELYAARVRGAGQALPEPVPYRAHIGWEQRRESDPAWEANVRYWQEEYADGVPQPVLPGDRFAPAIRRHHAGTVERDIDAETSSLLADAPRRLGVTSFTVMLAAYGYLLHQLSGQDDLVIGVPFARRAYPGGELVVGNCTAPVLVRSRLHPGAAAGDYRVRDYVRVIRAALMSAHEHPDFPVDVLRKRIRVGDGAGGRVFAASFNLNYTRPLRQPDGLRIRLLPAPRRFAKTDLTFDVLMTGQDLRLIVYYDATLFERPTVEQYTSVFLRLLHRFAADPGTPLARLSLTAADAPGRPIARVTVARTPEADSLTLPALVERRVGQSPQATAVRQHDEKLSYAELNARANRLARHLLPLGAGPERVVTLAMPRSPALTVAALAVLKTGAACHLPDLDQPGEKLVGELAAVRPALILTAGGVSGFPDRPGVVRVVVDDPASAQRISAGDDANLSAADEAEPLTAGHPAFVHTTWSDSGHPLVTVTTHVGAVHTLRVWREEHALTPRDQVLLAAPAPRGALLHELFRTLDAGATAVVGYRDDERGHEVRAADGVTRYGTAETSFWSPGGRGAASDTGVSVLDQYLRPVPPGFSGELYVGGTGLARGYLDQPGLTAERFVADPFGAPGARMYRTGQRVRLSSGGELAFSGPAQARVRAAGTGMGAGDVEAALLILPI